jgi:hypothetical protein
MPLITLCFFLREEKLLGKRRTASLQIAVHEGVYRGLHKMVQNSKLQVLWKEQSRLAQMERAVTARGTG